MRHIPLHLMLLFFFVTVFYQFFIQQCPSTKSCCISPIFIIIFRFSHYLSRKDFLVSFTIFLLSIISVLIPLFQPPKLFPPSLSLPLCHPRGPPPAFDRSGLTDDAIRIVREFVMETGSLAGPPPAPEDRETEGLHEAQFQ